MKTNIIKRLTTEYKEAAEKDWSIIRTNDAEIQLRDNYATLKAYDKQTGRERIVELSYALKNNKHIVLLGEPGSGKSTILQYIGLCCVRKGWQTKLNLVDEFIPIRISLRRYASVLAEPGPTIERTINLVLREYLRSISDSQASELVQAWIEQHILLILFDGLDEVNDFLRGEIADELNRFSTSPHNTTKVLVTTRPSGYVSIGSSFTEYSLNAFDGSNNVSSYLKTWLEVLRPDWSNPTVISETNYLLHQMIQHHSLRRFINNPLLLRLSAEIYTSTSQVVNNRSKLYRRYVDELWARAQRRGIDGNLRSQVMVSAEDIAWQLHTNKGQTVSIELLKIIKEELGLVITIGDKLAFNHTTLQEYFVSRRLAQAWKVNRSNAWDYLRKRLHVAGWREPILLMSGTLEQKDSIDLLKKILQARSRLESKLHRDKRLVLALIGEGALTNYQIIKSLLRKVWWGSSQLAKLFQDRYSANNDKVIRDLVHIGKPAVPLLCRMLKNDDMAIQEAAMHALAKMNATETIPNLLKLYKETPNYQIRSQTLITLGSLKAKEAVPIILRYIRAGDDYTGAMGAIAFGELKETELMPTLFTLLSDSNWLVAESAAKALGYMEATAIPLLRQALKSKDSRVRLAAVFGLAATNLPEVIPDLRDALQDKDEAVRTRSIVVLTSEMKAREVISDIRDILKNDEREHVRSCAATGLGDLMAEEALPDLKQSLKDSSKQVREAAGRSLRKLGYTGNLNSVSSKAAMHFALDQFRKHFPTGVYEPESSKVFDDRRQESINYLLQQIKNQNDAPTKWAAAMALWQLNAKEAIPELVIALNDENIYVRRVAARVLGEFNAREAIPALRDALKDKRVKNFAAVSLGKMKIFDVIPYLRQELKKDGSKFANDAYWVLRDLISDLPVYQNRIENDFYVRELRKLKRDGFEEKLVVERLEALEVNNLSNQDPFRHLPNPPIKAFAKTMILYLLIILGLILITTTATALGLAQDISMELFGQSIILWISSYPLIAFAIFVFLALVGGFLPWLIESARDMLRNK